MRCAEDREVVAEKFFSEGWVDMIGTVLITPLGKSVFDGDG